MIKNPKKVVSIILTGCFSIGILMNPIVTQAATLKPTTVAQAQASAATSPIWGIGSVSGKVKTYNPIVVNPSKYITLSFYDTTAVATKNYSYKFALYYNNIKYDLGTVASFNPKNGTATIKMLMPNVAASNWSTSSTATLNVYNNTTKALGTTTVYVVPSTQVYIPLKNYAGMYGTPTSESDSQPYATIVQKVNNKDGTHQSISQTFSQSCTDVFSCQVGGSVEAGVKDYFKATLSAQMGATVEKNKTLTSTNTFSVPKGYSMDIWSKPIGSVYKFTVITPNGSTFTKKTYTYIDWTGIKVNGVLKKA